MKLIILIFFLSFSNLIAFKLTTELEKKLDTAKGKNKVDIMNEIAEIYEIISLSHSLQYSNQAFIEALKINYSEGICIALSRMLIDTKFSLPSAFGDKLKETLIFFLNYSKNPVAKFEICNGLQVYFMNSNDFEAASYYMLLSLNICEKHHLQNELVRAYQNFGWFYRFLNDWENSAENYKKASDIFNPNLPQKLNNLKMIKGIEIMFDAGNDSLANFYLSKLLSNINSHSDSIVWGMYYKIKGKLEIKKNNYVKAEDYFQKSKQIFIDLELNQNLSDIYTLIAHVASLQLNFEKSLLNNKLALETRIYLGSERNIVSSLINISIDYYNLYNYDESIPLLKKSSDISKKYFMHHYYTRANEWLYKTYLKKNDIDSAYFFLEKYTNYQKEIKLIENAQKTIKFQMKYELEKKDKNIIELALSKEKNKNMYFFIILFLLLIIIIVFYFRFRQKKKDNQLLSIQNAKLEMAYEKISETSNELIKLNFELKKLNNELDFQVQERTKYLLMEIQQRKMAEESLLQSKADIQSAYEKQRELNTLKSRFFNMISHEFRTPMTVITSSAELISMFGEKIEIEKLNKQIFKIKNSIKHMTSLIEEVIDFNRVDGQLAETKIEKIELMEFLSEIISEQKITYNSTIEIIVISNENPYNFNSDKKLLRNILSNIIGNAVKYSPEGRAIEITVTKKESITHCIIKDSGIGIPSYDLNRIWEPFYRGKNVKNITGTGFGLYMVKEFIIKLGGDILINSEVNIGTTVSMIIPNNL